MRWLMWLYPREWRERYGDEFEVLLVTRPRRPTEWIDVLRGAVDAHLHRYAGSLGPRDRDTRRKEKRTMVIKITVAAVAIATATGGAFFGITTSGSHHSLPVAAPRSVAEAAGRFTGNGPPVTVAVTKRLPTPPYPGDMAVTGAGEAIAVIQRTPTPGLRQVPARTPVYLTIRLGASSGTISAAGGPSFCCTVGTTYIVRSARHTILREVYPSHAFLGPPLPWAPIVFSRRYTFPHPGVYRFIGRVSIAGLTSKASIRIRVTG